MRALSTLVQVAGAERIRAARAVVAEHVKKQLHPVARSWTTQRMVTWRKCSRSCGATRTRPRAAGGAIGAGGGGAAGQIKAVNTLLDFEPRRGRAVLMSRVGMQDPELATDAETAARQWRVAGCR